MTSRDGGSQLFAWLRWFLTTDEGAAVYARDILASVAVLSIIGLLLFTTSGVWPPLVTVESSSMTPHLQKGDLVFVMDEQRMIPNAAYEGTGVVTARTGTRVSYMKFNQPGDVIVYAANGDRGQTPIIHRPHFWVNTSENWYEKANSDYLAGADNCAELANCPAPHAGFITKGDANSQYDQVGENPLTGPVRSEWVIGTAELRIPYLGWLRIALT